MAIIRPEQRFNLRIFFRLSITSNNSRSNLNKDQIEMLICKDAYLLFYSESNAQNSALWSNPLTKFKVLRKIQLLFSNILPASNQMSNS